MKVTMRQRDRSTWGKTAAMVAGTNSVKKGHSIMKKSLTKLLALMLAIACVVATLPMLSGTAQAADADAFFNISTVPCSGNLDAAPFPDGTLDLTVGQTYYFNFAASSTWEIKSIYIYVKEVGEDCAKIYDNYTANGYFRWHNVSYRPSKAGNYILRVEIMDTNGNWYSVELNYTARKPIVDYTQEVYKGIILAYYENFLDLSYYENTDLKYLETIEKFGRFYKYFKDYSVFDVKRESRWKEMFPDIEFGTIIFEGNEVTPDELGNIIYGIVGSWLGFSERTLFQGGGYAACGITYLDSPENYYGDYKEDHDWIQIGINLGGGSGSLDIDLSILQNKILNSAATWILKKYL